MMPKPPTPKSSVFSTIGWAVVFAAIVTVLVVGSLFACNHARGGGTGNNPPSATQP
jgi:hypothetical protein